MMKIGRSNLTCKTGYPGPCRVSRFAIESLKGCRESIRLLPYILTALLPFSDFNVP